MRVAVVTGAASGIGAALARGLVARGDRVVLTDIQEEAGAALAAELGERAEFRALDVTDADAFDALLDGVARDHGRVDLLFNNAGLVFFKPAIEHTAAEWDLTLDVNSRGVMNGCRAALPRMKAQGGGQIVNTASIAGLVVIAQYPLYVFTKFSVVGLSLALRAEGRHYGVKVNALCPGGIRTPMTERQRADLDPKTSEQRARVEMDPDKFAAAALKRIDKDQGIIVLPVWMRPLWWLFRLAPGFMANLLVDKKRLRGE